MVQNLVESSMTISILVGTLHLEAVAFYLLVHVQHSGARTCFGITNVTPP